MLKHYTIALSLLCLGTFSAKAQVTFPVNGVHDTKHIVYAFTNAHIVIDANTEIDNGTLVVQDGLIKSVTAGKNTPKGANVIDLKGKYIYPGLIDVFTDYGMPDVKKAANSGNPQMISNTKGAYNWNQAIKAENEALKVFNANAAKADELRKLGFGAVNSVVHDGIARGTSVMVALSDEKENTTIIKDLTAKNFSFDKGSSTQDYPSSLMGSIALLRQTYYDAQWYKATNNKAEYNISLDAMNKNADLPSIFEVNDKYSALRAGKIGKEFNVKYIIKGAGDEYQRVNELKALGSAFIIPVNFPQPYDTEDLFELQNVQLSELKHWELAPSNPSALEKAQIPFAITTFGLKDKKDFWKNIQKAIEYGLTEKAALQALTTTPAQLLKVEDKVGSLKSGMEANFIITTKKLFAKDNVILENWVQGKEYKIEDAEKPDVRGTYSITCAKLPPLKLEVKGTALQPTATIIQDTAKLKTTFSVENNIVTFTFDSKQADNKGTIRFSGATATNWQGKALLPDGNLVDWQASLIKPYTEEPVKDSAKKTLVLGTLTYPMKAYGWATAPKAETVLIKNATVWTNEQQGILTETDVLISQGKIVSVGKNLSSAGAKVIDGTGKHVSPGIIDEHSHIAIYQGVNEGTQAVTSEVRIGDVINSDDINIYRQLAGGVTTSHLLHGSANPIGGQTQLIKLRWGLAPEQMKFEGADGFIKFALGENVKQSNWGDKNVIRFPQTRMGVEQVMIDAFTRAKEYEAATKAAGKNSTVRRDLELDALVEIMNKKRFITCHSYVQSEINMLMHVADSIGFKVNTFTHILEGYKVADKLKAHGANASTFADWWAYKYEVLEAIPYNGAIMHNMGLNVAFNSDDAEMARRLNQEAAKAVKYGHVSEEEAFKFVTLNPAKMLHIDNRTGSLKAGKDADVVIWSDNPLSIYAKVEKTFVDGICYYDIEQDAKLREDIQKEKNRLISKMADAKIHGEKTQKPALSFEEVYDCDGIVTSGHSHQ